MRAIMTSPNWKQKRIFSTAPSVLRKYRRDWCVKVTASDGPENYLQQDETKGWPLQRLKWTPRFRFFQASLPIASTAKLAVSWKSHHGFRNTKKWKASEILPMFRGYEIHFSLCVGLSKSPPEFERNDRVQRVIWIIWVDCIISTRSLKSIQNKFS